MSGDLTAARRKAWETRAIAAAEDDLLGQMVETLDRLLKVVDQFAFARGQIVYSKVGPIADARALLAKVKRP